MEEEGLEDGIWCRGEVRELQNKVVWHERVRTSGDLWDR